MIGYLFIGLILPSLIKEYHHHEKELRNSEKMPISALAASSKNLELLGYPTDFLGGLRDLRQRANSQIETECRIFFSTCRDLTN